MRFEVGKHYEHSTGNKMHILGEVNSYVVKRAIEHYGKDVQSTVCMEECAELIQAISKEKRGKSDKSHLAEEMADVIICIEMLKEIYSISDDMISEWIQIKEARIIERQG